jgi:uridine kinase
MTPIFVGVAGGTGAGKTALVRELIDRLGGALLDLDSYYRDRAAMPEEARHRLNYDEPGAIDHQLLVEHIDRLADGRSVPKPVYSFASHTRVGETVLGPARLIVVEGLFTWWWEPVRKRLAVKVFVDAPADLRLARRLLRDVTERRRSAEHVIEQYVQTVRPMHALYVEPGRTSADLLITNDGPLSEAVDRVTSALRQVVSDRSNAPLGAAMTG